MEELQKQEDEFKKKEEELVKKEKVDTGGLIGELFVHIN